MREELRERGIKQNEFARLIGMHASHLNEFIKGRRNLNVDLAIKLEEHLGIPYTMWMRLHDGYMYDCKIIEERNKAIAKEARKSSVSPSVALSR